MEQFLVDNAAHYNKLVAAYKPRPDIVVSTRIRPMLDEETAQSFSPGVFPRKAAKDIVDLHELRKAVRGAPSLSSFSFAVDHIFGSEATTTEIYNSLVKPLVPWEWGSGVGTLFAYSQTGSGKTFNVSGLERLVAETLISGSLDGERKIHVCVIKLAGQTAFDLLNSRKQISILEDSFPSAEDGMLYLVDLAGSEAARDRSAHYTARIKEAREINTGLSVLKEGILGRAMVDADIQMTGKSTKKAAYVPFRQSTLAKTLKHVFDPTGARKNTLHWTEMLRVVIPKAKSGEYNPASGWIDANGPPPISSALLAPTETGPQLLRFPIPEFLSRCLKTPEVSFEQAQAFQTKFWKAHVDAQWTQRNAAAKDAAEESHGLEPEVVHQVKLDCSADPEAGAKSIPFMQRIRPGIVVAYTPKEYFLSREWRTKDYAVILSAAPAVGERVYDLMEKPVRGIDDKGSDRGGRYLAAVIAPSLLPGSYTVNLWKHVVVSADKIKAEVLIEYAAAASHQSSCWQTYWVAYSNE